LTPWSTANRIAAEGSPSSLLRLSEPFANGLRRLLGGMNFTLQYDRDGRLATLTMLSNETADRGRAPPPPPAAAATIGSGPAAPASAAHADTPGVAVATGRDSTRIQHDAPPQIQHDE